MQGYRDPIRDDADSRIAPAVACAPGPDKATPPVPPIDYMAKDYASFRQALIDLIPQVAPEWHERHEADLGIVFLELLSHVADKLSYYQDAVANEAYLETARQRSSVGRHARLVDYDMHDGCSARTFVHFEAQGEGGTVPRGTQVLSRIEVPLGATLLIGKGAVVPVVPDELADQALNSAELVFETMADAPLHPLLNKIDLDFGDERRSHQDGGATSVSLVGDLAFDPGADKSEQWRLKPGDFLLFEEQADSQASRRHSSPLRCQVVRLTIVRSAGEALTWVAWDEADTLEIPLCLPSGLPRVGTPTVVVARGNIVLADHGRTLPDPECHRVSLSESAIRGDYRACRFRLREGPLSFRIPLESGTSARSLLEENDPRRAQPQVSLTVGDGAVALDGWYPASDLLGSGPSAQNFVVEIEHDGRAWIRFGNNEFGAALPEGSRVCARYRVGLGQRGNVGAGGLVHVVQPDSGVEFGRFIKAVRNPLAAKGGVDPEPIEEVKQVAPVAFGAEQLRAVTAEDYRCVAEKHPEVCRARTDFRWTGSWYTMSITVDPRGRKEVPPDLRGRLRSWVARKALADQHDIEIRDARYVPLSIKVDVWVDRSCRSDVEGALSTALGDGVRDDGNLGFFHPDNFTFGDRLYLSRLYEAVEAVEGVEYVLVTEFKRWSETSTHEPVLDYIDVEPQEIIRVDNVVIHPDDDSRSRSENGWLVLTVRGSDERRS